MPDSSLPRPASNQGPSSRDEMPRVASTPPPRIVKDVSVETLRGLAIILVVGSHVVLDSKNTLFNENPTIQSTLQYMFRAVWAIRFPLFIVISGYVYSMRPAVRGHLRVFLQGKFRRLLIPFFSVSLITYGLRCLMKDDFKAIDFWRAFVFPMEHLWFLPAMFLCIATFALFDLANLQATVGRWLSLLVAVSAGSLVLFQDETLGTNQAIFYARYWYVLPYFCLGCGLYRFPSMLFQRSVLLPAAVVCLVGFALQQLEYFEYVPLKFGRHGLVAICVGLTGNLLVVRFRPSIGWMAYLGSKAYTIYLFHFLCIALAVRIPFGAFGLTSSFPALAARMLAGLLLPLAVEAICRKSAILSYLFLGLVPAKPRESAAAVPNHWVPAIPVHVPEPAPPSTRFARPDKETVDDDSNLACAPGSR